MTASKPPSLQEPAPSAKKSGIPFKPWDMQDALISFAAVGVVFLIGSFLPRELLPLSALIAGGV